MAGPCRYCAVNHGGYWFPAASNNPDTVYTSLAIVKKNLCQGVIKSGITCDPIKCAATFSTAENPAMLVSRCHGLWRDYRDTEEGEDGGAYDDILDEFGLS